MSLAPSSNPLVIPKDAPILDTKTFTNSFVAPPTQTFSPPNTPNYTPVTGTSTATPTTGTPNPNDEKLLAMGVTPDQLKQLNSGSMDPSTFNNLISGVETRLKLNNDLVTTRGYLTKHLYDSPLTADELSKLPADIQRVINTGDKNAIELQMRLLNDQISGRANTLTQSISALTTGYQTAVQQKQDAIRNFISFSQQFPNPGDAAKVMTAIYGPEVMKQIGINIPELAHLVTTASVRYGSGGEGSMNVTIPGGTIASQTNNPLNIKYSATSTLGLADSGIQAQDGGTFASFNSPEEGLNAAIQLLQTPLYSNLNVDQAMRQWSNNGYGAEVSPSMNKDQKMSSLSQPQLQQLVSDMAKRESGSTTSYQLSDIQAIAQGIETGMQPPDLSRLYGKSAQVRGQLQRDKFDLAKATLQWQAATKWITALNSSQMARFKTLGVSVVNTIDEVTRLADELKLGGIPKMNLAELTAWVQINNNSPYAQTVIQYLSAANTLKEEFANLAQGGYAPTEASWELANKQINEYYGAEGLKSSLTEVQRLINYRLNAPSETTPTTPGGEDNPYSAGGSSGNLSGSSALFDSLFKQYGGK